MDRKYWLPLKIFQCPFVIESQVASSISVTAVGELSHRQLQCCKRRQALSFSSFSPPEINSCFHGKEQNIYKKP
ncbi:hypothetical protein UY3_12597 [Chelonia mydas]|uniref:Uncharacterized protein n=1 Tax=Chelonia mydas TaxID=8469 RepID=M7BQ51_CHEMY|nr:hypothetical protein UY3_12597 [Chelonia mydas]